MRQIREGSVYREGLCITTMFLSLLDNSTDLFTELLSDSNCVFINRRKGTKASNRTSNKYFVDCVLFIPATPSLFICKMASSSLLKSLSPLNWNLMMSGCTIYPPKNKLLRLLIYLQALVIILIQVFFCFAVLNGGTNPDIPVPILIIWQVMFTLCCVITIIFLLVYKRKILEIMERLDSLLTRQDYKQLYTFTLLILVGKLVLMAVSSWSYMILNIWIHYLKTGTISYRYYLWIWVSLNDRALISISVYLTVLKVIHLAEKRCIRSLISMICVGSENKNLSSVSAKTVFHEVDAFVQVKDDAMKILSIFPFLFFCYMFVESVGLIIELQASLLKKQIVYSCFLVSRLCVTLILAFVMSFMTSNFCSESKKKLKELQLNIISSRNSAKWNYVFEKIKEAKDYEYNAYGLFRMNKQLVLTFCSSLITFTVLFVQLMNPGR